MTTDGRVYQLGDVDQGSQSSRFPRRSRSLWPWRNAAQIRSFKRSGARRLDGEIAEILPRAEKTVFKLLLVILVSFRQLSACLFKRASHALRYPKAVLTQMTVLTSHPVFDTPLGEGDETAFLPATRLACARCMPLTGLGCGTPAPEASRLELLAVLR